MIMTKITYIWQIYQLVDSLNMNPIKILLRVCVSIRKKNLETQIKTHKANISPILIASKKGAYALQLA
jgi:hypothetical protein